MLRTRDPKINDVILLATPIYSFMLITIALRCFYSKGTVLAKLAVPTLCTIACDAHAVPKSTM